jgi:hypothetical protein
MQTIKGAPDKFLGQITELLANKEVTSKDFGILAWAPHLADQYEKKDGIREVSARYELQSRHIGNIGDKLVVNFSIIDKRYVQRMDCYAVYGVTEEGNLVFYWAKTLDKVCESGTIAGRVKAHNKDQYRNNAKVTILNYIKVL